MKFSEFNFSNELMEGLEAMRFEEATPIQIQSIPIILEKSDLIACAQTGTGKTAAYLLPVLDNIIKKGHNGINTVILVPTRELALQIDQQLEGFSYFLQVTSLPVYGGGNSGDWDTQKRALVEGADIIVATPGRLISHLALGYVELDKMEHLILDEADRMLDMGFFEDLMQIVSFMPKQRQNLMFSATMPPKIKELAQQILTNPKEVAISISKPAENILQAAYVVYDGQKLPIITSLLKGKDLPSIIIFSSRKTKTKEIAMALRKLGFNADAIHSDLEQNEREEALLNFRNRKTQILVATDIIARGIDIENIDMVINFDVPRDAEDYVHRIGRTARAKSEGIGLTFVNEEERFDFAKIEKLIEKEIFKVPVPEEFGKTPTYNPEDYNRKPGKKNHHKGKNKFWKKKPAANN